MRALLAAVLLIATGTLSAGAQLLLPGAVPAQKKPARPNTGTGTGRAKPIKSAPIKTLGEESIVGQDLSLNGGHGRIVFARSGDALSATSLTMDGAQISRPDESCRVDVVAGQPIPAKPLGRPAGALRYQLDLEACPFSFDILNGAILVAALPGVCEFIAADCKVDPAGLWGPRASSLGPAKIKEIEHARSRAETLMHENFRDLLSRTHGKAAIKATAGDQAGFTSLRTQICQDYAREDQHGFCALTVTEARAMALKVMLGQVSQDIAEKKPEKKKGGRRGAVPM